MRGGEGQSTPAPKTGATGVHVHGHVIHPRQCSSDSVHRVGRQRVVDPAAAPFGGDQPIIPEDLQVVAQQVGCDREMLCSSHTHAVPLPRRATGRPPNGIRDSLQQRDGPSGSTHPDVVSIEIDSITIELYLWRP